MSTSKYLLCLLSTTYFVLASYYLLHTYYIFEHKKWLILKKYEDFIGKQEEEKWPRPRSKYERGWIDLLQ